MIVRVKLFAVARQRIGRSEIEVDLPGDRIAAGRLRAAIVEQFPPLAEIVASARLAVNNEYASDQYVLPPHAEVALIPPVSGG